MDDQRPTGLCFVAVFAAAMAGAGPAPAQTVTQRGFVEVRGTLFPQEASHDPVNAVADVRAREELFARPAGWLGLAGGVDALANTHDQVDASWRLDVADRGVRRPALALRRLTATITRGGFTLDVGKQFIRWGKADIVTPTDRFAPRDYLNVIDNELLAVRGGRAALTAGPGTLEAVVVPWFTPSRIPLFDQRWTVVPAGVALVDATTEASLPDGTQVGARWSHTGSGYEYSASFFDGYNHLPTLRAPSELSAPLTGSGGTPAADPAEIQIARTYPRMRMYGGDAAIPTRWFTLKAEAALFTSSTPGTDEYALYVVQLERQTGEWLLIGGYAGLAVTADRSGSGFAPDRGTARSVLGRASYTIDANRSAAVESAVRQNGHGVYVKGEYTQATGRHWRTTLAGAVIGGDADDFLGQFRRNSYLVLTGRYSF
jgi:hypothetical protein